MTKREKGKKWDGISRIPTDEYKNNWNDIFRKKKDESPSNTSTTKRKPNTTGDRKES